MDKEQSGTGAHLRFLFAFIIITPILLCGCSHFYEGSLSRSTFEEANNLFSQGSYKASLSKYEQMIERYPTAGDRVLFEKEFTKTLLVSPSKKSPITHARCLIAHIGFHALRLKGVDIAKVLNLSPAAVSKLAARGTGNPAEEEIMRALLERG
jgi:hypothetical protein